ncbi:hypothetical protein AB0I00_26510 [Streptomyces sp. NPDC050803]|uniref:hypothetical protein n=1 Tax=unclassified Streptomyces TaxID=2593676 RepID=UPI00341B42CC
MTNGTNAMLVGMGRREAAAVSGRSRRLRGSGLLAAVAGAFTAAQLLLVPPATGLGWDETVYVSQVGDQAPAAFFSAPRARGVTLLVAPIASWSSSTSLLRVYLAVLSGLALYLALRAWRGLFPPHVLAAAGALFASLWVTLFYAPQAMPNLWVALGALLCVGCFLRARADRLDRRALWGVATGAALMALMRPTDAVWVTLPLLVAVVALRQWRSGLALVTGLLVAAAPWVIEAYVSYGGLRERLAEASRVQGGLGWNLAVDDQMRSLVGRTLCRPCTGSMPNPAVTLWWVLLPLLALLGLAVAIRAGRTARTLIPLACAATAAVPYLFLIGYAAPRFLLPAYALLAIPVADGLLHLVTAPNGRLRPVAATLVACGLLGHLAVQYAVLDHTVDRTGADRRAWAHAADRLHDLGVRPPCLLTGHQAIPLAYYAGCSSGAIAGNNANTTPAQILRTARSTPVAALTVPGTRPPAFARDWELHRFDRLDVRIAPSAREGGGLDGRGASLAREGGGLDGRSASPVREGSGLGRPNAAPAREWAAPDLRHALSARDGGSV